MFRERASTHKASILNLQNSRQQTLLLFGSQRLSCPRRQDPWVKPPGPRSRQSICWEFFRRCYASPLRHSAQTLAGQSRRSIKRRGRLSRHVAPVAAARDIVARPQAYLSDGRVGCYMACQFRRASPTPPVAEQAGALAIAPCVPTRPRCKPTPSIFAHAPPWAGLKTCCLPNPCFRARMATTS